jgi:hypothetical protein
VLGPEIEAFVGWTAFLAFSGPALAQETQKCDTLSELRKTVGMRAFWDSMGFGPQTHLSYRKILARNSGKGDPQQAESFVLSDLSQP